MSQITRAEVLAKKRARYARAGKEHKTKSLTSWSNSSTTTARRRSARCNHGLALMVLPTLIVGNELLILGGVATAVALWFLAHRHGKLQGLVDANSNGLDDRTE